MNKIKATEKKKKILRRAQKHKKLQEKKIMRKKI